MHLKNYSFITINDVVQLSPGYDLINTSIAIGINKVKEQIALPINGKKSNLTYKDLVTLLWTYEARVEYESNRANITKVQGCYTLVA